jgi:PPE-repeat protein
MGSSAQAAATAFELAHRTVVLPLQVSANRTQLAELLATNWFGTKLPAIAANEGQYEGMWVNNSAAMYRYQAAAQRALVLPQFASPPTIVDPAAAAQLSTVPAAAAAASPAQSTIGDLLNTLNHFPGGFNPQTGWFGLVNTYISQFQAASGFPISLLGVLAQVATAKGAQSLGEVGQGLSQEGVALGAAEADLANALRAAGSTTPTAAVGVGVSLGKLTAPPATVGLLSASHTPVQLASVASPLAAEESGLPFMPPPMMPPVAPRKGKGKSEGRDYDDLEIGLEIKGTFMTRPPSAG